MRCTGAPQTGHGWLVAAVHRHLRVERGDLLGTAAGLGLGASRSIHSSSSVAGRRVAAARSPRRSSERVSVTGESLRAVQDLVGVRVADAAEQARIGQRALQRVVLARAARAANVVEARRSARRCRPGRVRASAASPCDDVQRRAPLAAGFGERERAGRRTRSSRERVARRRLRAALSSQCRRPAIIRWITRKSSPSSAITTRLPSRSTPCTVLAHGDAIGGTAVRSRNGFSSRTASSALPDDARGEALDVDRDVGQLGHRCSVPSGPPWSRHRAKAQSTPATS